MDTLARLFKPDLAGERDNEPEEEEEAVLLDRGLFDDVAPVVVI